MTFRRSLFRRWDIEFGPLDVHFFCSFAPFSPHVSTMVRGLDVLLHGWVACYFCTTESRGESLAPGYRHRELSFEELTMEAAKHGMEVIPQEEWMESRRRLQYQGG